MAQVHVITGVERRRRWSDDQKRMIVAAAFAPGAVVVEVARRANVSSALIYRWRRELRPTASGFAEVVVDDPAVAPPTGPCGSAGPALEVMVGADIRIRIPTSTPSELAAAVLSALARR